MSSGVWGFLFMVLVIAAISLGAVMVAKRTALAAYL